MLGVKEVSETTLKSRTKEQPVVTNGNKAPASTEAHGALAPSKPANPFTFMRRFAEEMDRLFEDFGFGYHIPSSLGRARELLRRETGVVEAEWSPRMEVHEREGKIVVRADLPGLSKDDVKVELSDEMLTIQGERRKEKKEERKGYSYNECTYGSFYRAIPLPEGVDTAKASAHFQNGVLQIEMPAPLPKKPQPKRLEIREKA
jgi:HSP20 family protein